MKAVITGTPLQIDGEPAEIAQLVELLSSGAVMVEHVHHWRLELPDDDGVQEGKCWCGQSKAFAPFGETNAIKRAAANTAARAADAANVAPATTAAKVTALRTCGCGPKGKHGKNCQLKQPAAA